MLFLELLVAEALGFIFYYILVFLLEAMLYIVAFDSS